MLYRHDHSVWLPYILFQTEGVTTVDRQLSCQYELTVKLVLNIRGQAHTIHYINKKMRFDPVRSGLIRCLHLAHMQGK